MHPPISVQLYTVRDAAATDLTGTLRRLTDLGYDRVELFGLADRAAEFADAVAETGVRVPSAHTGLVNAPDVGAVLDAAERVGVGTLIEPAIPEERWRDREAIEVSAARLGELAVIAADRGIRIGYHNHWWELEGEVDGRVPLELFAELLDPEVLLEVDTYWAEVGGVAAAGLLERLGERVQFLHVKDGPVSRDPLDQQPPGRGSLDVVSILAAAPQAMRVIELDDYRGDMFAALGEARAFVEANDPSGRGR